MRDSIGTLLVRGQMQRHDDKRTSLRIRDDIIPF